MLDNLSYSVNWHTSKIDRNSQLLKISEKKLKFKIMIKSIITANSLQMIRTHFDSFFHTSARSVKLSLQKLKLSHQNLNQKYSRCECRSLKILVIFFSARICPQIFFMTPFFGEKKWRAPVGFRHCHYHACICLARFLLFFLCSFILSHLLRLPVC